MEKSDSEKLAKIEQLLPKNTSTLADDTKYVELVNEIKSVVNEKKEKQYKVTYREITVYTIEVTTAEGKRAAKQEAWNLLTDPFTKNNYWDRTVFPPGASALEIEEI
jgi:hypothetical protein